MYGFNYNCDSRYFLCEIKAVKRKGTCFARFTYCTRQQYGSRAEGGLGIFYVSVYEKDCAIRPALKLDMVVSLDTESSGLWSYAGTEELEVPTGW
ncbi:MAG: hypothetical protein K1W39_03355 [Lachnospiraceae bacterium]|nr:hypothetical protein [Lachnospiraceae bacterium]